MNKGRPEANDILSIRIVDIDGSEAVNDYVMSLPGYLLLEIFMTICLLRQKLNEKTEDKFPEFLKGDELW